MTMINLQQFCSTELGREYLHTPFARNGRLYATNGHILVRVKHDASPAGHPKAPDAEKLFPNPPPAVVPLPMVELPAPEPEPPCEVCNGTGQDDGQVCFCCDGDGKGWVPDPVTVQIGSAYLASKYYRMLTALPNCRIQVTAEMGYTDTPVYFTFDGGDGLLMGMRGEAKQNIVAIAPETESLSAGEGR